jgi:hypothetical protein
MHYADSLADGRHRSSTVHSCDGESRCMLCVIPAHFGAVAAGMPVSSVLKLLNLSSYKLQCTPESFAGPVCDLNNPVDLAAVEALVAALQVVPIALLHCNDSCILRTHCFCCVQQCCNRPNSTGATSLIHWQSVHTIPCAFRQRPARTYATRRTSCLRTPALAWVRAFSMQRRRR